MYELLKTAHVILGFVLMALIMGVVTPVIYGLRCYPTDWQKRTLKRSLFLSLFGVIPVSMLQLLLGFSVIAAHPYSVSLFWIRALFVGFAVYLFSWCASIYCLSTWRLARGRALRDGCAKPKTSYYYSWLSWTLLASASLFVIVFMMTNRVVL